MITSSTVIGLVRKLWYRLPYDGAGVLPPSPRQQRMFQRVAARGFWKRLPRGSRLVSMTAARLLWLAACPFKTATELRSESATLFDLWVALWAGWTLGRNPRETVRYRAMARGDRMRLRLARDTPTDMQGVRLLAALGNSDDARLAADKLAMAERLLDSGLPAPATRAVVTSGRIPDITKAPWAGIEKLVLKPRHGSASKGLFSVAPLGNGEFIVDGKAPVNRIELLRILARRAQRDALLVQPHIGVSGDTRDLSADAPAVVRVFAMRSKPGERASVVSAMVKILPPGREVPVGTTELLVVPIAVETGVLEDGILFNRPRERWPQMPWNGAQVRGRNLAQWPEVMDIVVRGSEILQATPVIGWDVLLGPDGPVLLEANTGISLFRAMLWHFEHGVPSPLYSVLETWCDRHNG